MSCWDFVFLSCLLHPPTVRRAAISWVLQEHVFLCMAAGPKICSWAHSETARVQSKRTDTHRGPLQRGRDKTLLPRTMSASTPCLAAGPLELSSTCFRSSGCCLTCLSCSPGVSVTSSNTGVPDISGSVYSKTQVSVWFVLQEGAVLLRSTSLALRAPSQAMRSLPLGAASQGGGKCLASPSLEQL